MKLHATASRLLLAATFTVVGFLPAGLAQAPITANPDALEATLLTGQEEVHALTLSNASGAAFDYRVMVGGDNPSGTVVDSLHYTTIPNSSHTGNFIPGAGDVTSVAMRFTAHEAMHLNALRVFVNSIWQVEHSFDIAIYRIDGFDPDDVDPLAGELLTTGSHTQPAWDEEHLPASKSVITLDHPVWIEAGEDFFVVITRDVPGENLIRHERRFDEEADTANRAYYLNADGWNSLGNLSGTVPAVFWIHALELGIDWLDPLARTGTIPAGGNVELQVRLSAAGLPGGEVSGMVHVAGIGSDIDGVNIPTTLMVNGAPHAQVAPLALDFGEVQVGGSASDVVTITNGGTDPLTIGALTVNGDAFTVESGASGAIEPGAMMEVHVAFSPTSLGDFSGALTVESDDPTNPEITVTLTGTAVDAPAIEVMPEALTSVLQTGQSEIQTLSVSNHGAADLDFQITLTTPAARAATGTVDALLATATEPLPTGTAPLAPAYRASGGLYTDSLYYDNPTGYVQPYFFTAPLAVRFTATEAFNLTAIRAWFDDVVQVKVDVYAGTPGGHPSSGQLLLETVAPIDGESGLAEIALGASLNFEAGDVFYVVLRPMHETGLVGATQSGPPGGASYWFNNAVGWTFFGERWVVRALGSGSGSVFSISPTAGTLGPNQSLDVDVTFDASGVFAGTYERLITFHSNDPVTPALEVPATLMVGGQPIITVSPLALDFGDVYVGYSDTLNVVVANPGSEALEVASVTASHGAFTTPLADGFTVQPNQQRSIRVAFSPLADEAVEAELIIASNDPDQPEATVSLTATAVLPGHLAVDPGSLAAELDSGMTEVQTLTLTNDGPGELHYSFAGYDAENRTSGGPDGFGYRWIDSNQIGGPFYDWVDITASGLDLNMGRHDVRAVELPFPFPFYGEMRDTVYVYSHGVLNFDLIEPASHMWFPKPLPHIDAPDAIIAPMWLELAPDEQGQVFAGTDDQGRFVITYHQVRGFWQDDSYYTFQAVLSPDGTILFQYDDIQGIRAHRASVGIENDDASAGLGIVYRQAYVHDGLAVQISTTPSWVTDVSPAVGTIASGASQEISVVFDATDLAGGLYTDNLVIESSDPDAPETLVPVSLSVDGASGGLRTYLHEGWNLFSTSLDLEDGAPEAVFAGVMDRLELVAKHHGDQWLSWRPAGGEENTLQTIDPMYSYWVRLSAPGHVDIAGEPMDVATPIDLHAGTNSVTYLPGRAHGVDDALESVMDATTAAMTFYGTGITASPLVPQEFQLLSQMQPKMGYLLRASGAATLVYPAGASGAGDDGEPGSGTPRPTLAGALAAEADAGVTATVAWVSIWGDDIRFDDGTLIPENTVITAHTPEGLVVGAFKTVAEGRIGLMSVYGDDPFTEAIDGALAGEEISVRADGQELGTITWTAFGDVHDLSGFVVSNDPAGDSTPGAFALHQNYPNPFNPETTISFELPEAGHVTLRVYDTLGREIAVLVDAEHAAGAHDVTWNASGVASGVYIYRIDAGTHSETRRMLLLR